jgi:hypothetical protein
VFEQEIQDFLGSCEEKQQFDGESAQKPRPLSLTTPDGACSTYCPPATRKMSPPGQFHPISIDEFALLEDVAILEFRAKTIGEVAIVSGYHPRFA